MPTIPLNDIALFYHDTGRGVPLLLAHGFPFDHTMWDAQIAALSGRCRVIAPDLRGFGLSGVTVGAVTIEQMADDLAALLDLLSIADPIVFCGLSMGGYIAFEFWRKHAAKLKALVLCDTRAAADKPDVAANRLATADRVLRDGPRSLVDSMLPKLFSPRTYADQPGTVEAMQTVMMRADPRGIAAAARGMAERRDFTAQLGSIRVPTLLIVGADDSFTPPAEMQAISAAMPLAQFHVVPAAGHLSPYEQPTLVNAVVESFIAGLA
jgi:3-oxoadipate enol-lactonase